MMNPAVTVVLSVYNARPYLKECIESVLNQSFKDFEFLIVDDGSTDGSWEIIQMYSDRRMIPYQISNSGVARAKNFLIEKARGMWVAVIDADDVWHPLKLEIQIKFLDQNPKCVLLGSFCQIIDKDGQKLYIEPKVTDWPSLSRIIEHRNLFTHSAVIYSLDAWKKAGGYNDSVHQYLADYELMKALCNVGEAANLPVALVQYRIVPHSVTRGFSRSKRRVSRRIKRANYHYTLARIFVFYVSKPKDFLLNILQCILLNPWQLKAYALLTTGIIPPLTQIVRNKILQKEHFTYLSQLTEPEDYLSRLS